MLDHLEFSLWVFWKYAIDLKRIDDLKKNIIRTIDEIKPGLCQTRVDTFHENINHYHCILLKGYLPDIVYHFQAVNFLWHKNILSSFNYYKNIHTFILFLVFHKNINVNRSRSFFNSNFKCFEYFTESMITGHIKIIPMLCNI